MFLFWSMFWDERGTTLAITRKVASTSATAAAMNANYAEIEAVINGNIDGDNIKDDGVAKGKLASDVVRSGYGLAQHTDGALQIDVSDTSPGLEISDGGVRAKVDDSSIERASGGLQVKALGITNAMLAGSITAAKLAGSITDSLLNQITTAGKVHGTSITGLASLPADAGVIPSTSLPPGLGTWVDKSASCGAQVAETDIDIFASCTVAGGAAGTITIWTGADADPSTVKQPAGIDGSHVSGVELSVNLKCKKGHSWKVVITGATIDKVWIISTGS